MRDPREMIPHVKSIIVSASAKKLVAAGYFERSAYVKTFANKRGNSAMSEEPTLG